jgi:hypothetical protein
MEELVTDRANQSLAHVFTVLALVLPREPLRIAYRALHTTDARLRGTALEYLELTLPRDIHNSLSPFLDGSRGDGTLRSREEVLAELLMSNDSVLLNLSDLKRQGIAAAEGAAV